MIVKHLRQLTLQFAVLFGMFADLLFHLLFHLRKLDFIIGLLVDLGGEGSEVEAKVLAFDSAAFLALVVSAWAAFSVLSCFATSSFSAANFCQASEGSLRSVACWSIHRYSSVFSSAC
jgi:hypothetical protein